MWGDSNEIKLFSCITKQLYEPLKNDRNVSRRPLRGICVKKGGNQRGLKHTERKPLGIHYLGVTHFTMRSAVQTLIQLKAWIGIMAIVVYSCLFRQSARVLLI